MDYIYDKEGRIVSVGDGVYLRNHAHIYYVEEFVKDEDDDITDVRVVKGEQGDIEQDDELVIPRLVFEKNWKRS